MTEAHKELILRYNLVDSPGWRVNLEHEIERLEAIEEKHNRLLIYLSKAWAPDGRRYLDEEAEFLKNEAPKAGC